MHAFISANDVELVLPAVGPVKVCQVKFYGEGALLHYKVISNAAGREVPGKRFLSYLEASHLLPDLIDAIACKGPYAGKSC